MAYLNAAWSLLWRIGSDVGDRHARGGMWLVPFAGNVTLLGEASIVEQPEGELLYRMCGVESNLANAMTFHDADHVALVPCVARRPH